MQSVDVTQSDNSSNSQHIQHKWPAPLNGREWDRLFPGVMDGIGVLGGGANVIMQLALLPVGYGVADSKVESGALFKHPIKRARTTFTYLAVAMMGTTEEKLAYRKAVNKSHTQVRSAEGDKVQYNAFDPELQLWVAACLYWGFMDTYSKLYGEPDRARLEEFYRMAEPLGTTLQVRPGMWPADLDAFDRYWQAGLNKLQIDDKVRTFLTRLVDLKFLHPVLSRPFGPFHRFITTGFLPQTVRDQMRLDWSPSQQQNFDRFMKTVGGVNRLMPRLLRQFPFNLVMWDFRRRLRKGLPLV
ncbi:MAG TPA: oxygenase MpaB family protein [Dongiaceae bacterium]|nr:oxygenase MpaB family protein [Dongiaceae bacterium]